MTALSWQCHFLTKNEPKIVFLKYFRCSLFFWHSHLYSFPGKLWWRRYCIGEPAGGLSATYGCFVAREGRATGGAKKKSKNKKAGGAKKKRKSKKANAKKQK